MPSLVVPNWLKRKLFPPKDLKKYGGFPDPRNVFIYWIIEGTAAMIIYFLGQLIMFLAGLTSLFALYNLASGELAFKATLYFILQKWVAFFMLSVCGSYIMCRIQIPDLPTLMGLGIWIVLGLIAYLSIQYLTIPFIFYLFPSIQFNNL